ncbi:acyl-coenzyme A amino acid N-acyltransferase 1-like [Pecten maximus]|uniref:acyl-coenzyme A amino acid N-acyltransferase 1-like n=1 Tax=Pecten maximus TaxID=6579 RepID=UPI001458DC2B|nr:acyl-coenzyme A amino acid N-acyltransferase 1-like [Pecten maximus]
MSVWRSALGACFRRAHCKTRKSTGSMFQVLAHEYKPSPWLQKTFLSPCIKSMRFYTSSNPDIELCVDKYECLMDEDIVVKVTGLYPSNRVIVLATTEHNGNLFWSHGLFRANGCGVVDLSTDSPISGSYDEADPSGLIWSMVAAPWLPAHTRMFQPRAIKPRIITFSVFPESDSPSDYLKDKTKLLASIEHKRWYKSSNTRRIPIDHPRLQGTVFLPEGCHDDGIFRYRIHYVTTGPGPFPGVIDMYGGLVTIVEGRAALLASQGFATLCLSYVHAEGLPQSLLHIELGYFEVIMTQNVTIHMPLVSFSRIEETGIQLNEEGVSIRDLFVVPDKAYFKPWIHGAHLLTILGSDDLMFAVDHTIHLYKDMPQNYYSKKATLVIYPGAGHMIETPNTPLTRVLDAFDHLQQGINLQSWKHEQNNLLLCGGYPKEHAAAQRDAWQRSLNFLRKHLR